MGARCHQSVTRRTLTYMSADAWRARILRVVRERKKLHNSTSAVSMGEQPTRGPSYACRSSLVHPAARADYSKKSCDPLCVAIFSVPIFDSKKIHLFKKFQKVSKSFGFLNFVESRFQSILKSLYFWDRVSTFLKKSSRPVTV